MMTAAIFPISMLKSIIKKGRNSNPTGMFGYQGQERVSNGANDMGSSRWYNFQLRMYNPAIARFNTIDPYSQFNSPYLAMANNPISFIDPDGGKAVLTEAKRNQILRNLYFNKKNLTRREWLSIYLQTTGNNSYLGVTLEGIDAAASGQYGYFGVNSYLQPLGGGFADSGPERTILNACNTNNNFDGTPGFADLYDRSNSEASGNTLGLLAYAAAGNEGMSYAEAMGEYGGIFSQGGYDHWAENNGYINEGGDLVGEIGHWKYSPKKILQKYTEKKDGFKGTLYQKAGWSWVNTKTVAKKEAMKNVFFGNIYDTKQIKHTFYQQAFLPADGVGAFGGSYAVKSAVNFTSKSGKTMVNINASGLTAASMAGKVKFSGTASLVVDGQVKYIHPFKLPEGTYMYQSGTIPLGSTDFILPDIAKSVSIVIDVGYSFWGSGFNGGAVIPIPSSMERTIKIPIIVPYNNYELRPDD